MMHKNLLHNKTKLIIQAAVLVGIIGFLIAGLSGTSMEAYCPFGGLMSIGSKLWLGSMSCSMGAQQVVMGIALLVAVILFSKLFCGFLCPIGTISEWLNRILGKFRKNIVLRGVFDKVLRAGKYVLLFFAAYMTITSSELWCKNFDPYYATVSGFDGDVTKWAAILTITSVLVLSVVFRMFWCKYVCPLGALSNIFQNILISVPIIIVFAILRAANVNIDIVWLLLALCISGAATEIFRFKFFSVSPFRVKVNKDSCISCGLCDKACPQGIEVSKCDKVTHPDCTLCMDCVEACNTKDAIQVSTGKSKWIPPVVTIALVVLAFIIGKNYHLTTISERWGGFDNIENVGVFEMKGLKSVKCFGSAKSLQSQLMRKKGIVGLDAWADVNRVKVYYDADQMDDDDIRETIFKPAKYKVSTMKADPPQELTVFEVPVDGVFDAYDNAHLVRMFRQNGGICGMATSYGEPVLVAILFDAEQTSAENIKKTIEQGEYTLKKGDKEEVVEVEFECATEGEITGTVKYTEFLKDYFSGYSRFFNDFKKYEDEQVGIYEISFPKAEVSTIRRKLGYLSSHLSFNDNIIGIKTAYVEKPVLRVYFVKDSVSEDTIGELLTVEMLHYMSKDGEKETENIFEFEGDVKVFDYEK